jgi:hypothetical protein
MLQFPGLFQPAPAPPLPPLCNRRAQRGELRLGIPAATSKPYKFSGLEPPDP